MPNTEPLKGRQLSDALAGTYEQRMEGEKVILLKMHTGTRPEVTFTGFWTGRLVRSAMDSISRAYRMRKNRKSYPIGDVSALGTIIPAAKAAERIKEVNNERK